MSDEADPDALAERVVDQLDPGSVIGDKVVISKQQAAAVLAGSGTLAGVLGVGVGTTQAQSSGGQLGTDSEPIEADLGNYGSTSTADGHEITIEGDSFQFNE